MSSNVHLQSHHERSHWFLTFSVKRVSVAVASFAKRYPNVSFGFVACILECQRRDICPVFKRTDDVTWKMMGRKKDVIINISKSEITRYSKRLWGMKQVAQH